MYFLFRLVMYLFFYGLYMLGRDTLFYVLFLLFFLVSHMVTLVIDLYYKVFS